MVSILASIEILKPVGFTRKSLKNHPIFHKIPEKPLRFITIPRKISLISHEITEKLL